MSVTSVASSILLPLLILPGAHATSPGGDPDVPADVASNHYEVIRFNNTTHLIRVDPHDYILSYMNLGPMKGRLEIYDGDRLIDSAELRIDGSRRIYNSQERELRFDTRGVGFFSLTHPYLTDAFGDETRTYSGIVDGRLGLAPYRGGARMFLCASSAGPMDAEIYSSEFNRMGRYVATDSIVASFPKDVAFYAMPMFITTNESVEVNVTISTQDCAGPDGPDGRSVPGTRASVFFSVLWAMIVMIAIRARKRIS